MSGVSEQRRPDDHHTGLDRELSLKGVVWFSIGLVLAILGAAAVMWWLSVSLRDDLASGDPRPSVIPEARAVYQPPGPALQDHPEAELIQLRAEEEAVLSSYQWLDEATGVAQIPVERAIAIVAAEAQVAPESVDAGASE